MIAYSPYRFRVKPLRLGCGQPYGKVATNACGRIEVRSMIGNLVLHVVFWPAYLIGSSLMETI